jgi:hypothetical protein
MQTRLQNAVLGRQVLILQQPSTSIIEDCDPSTHLNILITRGSSGR